MKNRAHEDLLARVEAPSPAAGARDSARTAALAEFARVHAANESAAAALTTETATKGTEESARLSRNDKGGRSPMMMTWFRRRSVFGAFASACVVAFAAALLWPIISQRVAIPTEERITYIETRPPPPPPPRPRDETATPSAKQPEPEKRGRVRVQIAPKPQPAQAGVQKKAGEQGYAAQLLVNEKDKEGQEVTVTGVRRALEASIAASPAPVDVISSEDIADAPAPPKVVFQTTPLASMPEMRAAKFDGNYAMAEQFKAEGDDKFQHYDTNPVKRVAEEPVSTFSVDVDTASYSFARRQLDEGVLPQKDAVRVEEMVNYFDYSWPKATARDVPFEPTIVVTDSPWGKGRKLVHIGIKGYDVPRDKAPDVNLVLLLDVSGSMNSPDKLPLAISSMELLLSSLKPTDTVGIVVYAGEAGTVLEPTPVKDRQKIVDALRNLQPGGSTAGAAGIERAYQLAQKNFRKGGVNRILLATDGDFNVGIDGTEELKGYVEREREKGVMLSVLGFGQGNYRDEMAQALAQNGNGVAAYIDTLSEAQKVLVDESSGSLFTIAKDVKIQVEFNPSAVSEYRLVGYETRALKREDFNNDAVDAGDVGSGHTVTAIYEITPVGAENTSVDPLRYGATDAKPAAGARAAEYGFVKIRYKLPDEAKSRLMSRPIPLTTSGLSALVAREVRFSTAVAGFAQMLRGGKYTGSLTYDDVIREAQASKGDDPFGYRTEFVQLARKAKSARGM